MRSVWPTAISTEPLCTQLTPSSATGARRERRHPISVNLAQKRAVALDPFVWSGRASQEGFVELASKRSCINVSGLWLEQVMLRAIMEISARAISLRDRPQWAKWVTSARRRREDRSSILSEPLADLGREGYLSMSLGIMLKHVRRSPDRAGSPQRPDHAP